MVYDVEEGKVVHSEIVDTNGSGHGALAGVLNALKALKDEKVVDIRKVYKNGVTDFVMDNYRRYLEK